MLTIAQLTSTCDKLDDAERIVQQLLTEKLIACGQISGPINSHYRWRGENTHSQEFVVLVKTSPQLLPAVTARIAELHPYEVPEIIGQHIDTVHQAYAEWVHDEVKK
jgi:periplasmic divalent cation tolerance protein